MFVDLVQLYRCSTSTGRKRKKCGTPVQEYHLVVMKGNGFCLGFAARWFVHFKSYIQSVMSMIDVCWEFDGAIELPAYTNYRQEDSR